MSDVVSLLNGTVRYIVKNMAKRLKGTVETKFVKEEVDVTAIEVEGMALEGFDGVHVPFGSDARVPKRAPIFESCRPGDLELRQFKAAVFGTRPSISLGFVTFSLLTRECW